MEVIFTNKTFIAGGVSLIIGFLILQFGLTILLGFNVLELTGNSLRITVEGGLLFEAIGGIILLVGLMTCIQSVNYDRKKASYNTQQYLNKLSSDISALDRKIDNNTVQTVQLATMLKDSKTASPIPSPSSVPAVSSSKDNVASVSPKDAVTCKFCHTKISKNTIFCSSCGRSQV